MSLNVWYGELLGELLAYLTSKKDSVSAFCFQETDHATLQALDKLLGEEFARHHMHKNAAGEPEQFDVATYIRRGVTVTSATGLLHDTPKAGVGLACELQLSPTLALRLVNVHGQPQPGDKLDAPLRIAQSKGLLHGVANDDTPTIFIGDFNLLPETQSVQLFTAADYRNLIDDFGIATTRNELAWARYPDNKQLHADYAFVRLNDLFDYDFSVEDIPVSDHLPLTLTLHHTPLQGE